MFAFGLSPKNDVMMLLDFFSNKNSNPLITELLIYGVGPLLVIVRKQEFYIFSRRSGTKPSFVTTGKKRDNPHEQ